MGGINLGSIPTWVAGVGTVGTLSAALVQIRGERKRRLSQEIAAAKSLKESQAQLIAAWAGRAETPLAQNLDINREYQGRTPINLINSSNSPVYSLVASIVFIQGAAYKTTEELMAHHGNGLSPTTTIAILPPGAWRIWIPGSHWSGILGGRSGAELAFTDRAGIHWIRRATGVLEEISEPPFHYFQKLGLHGPYELQVPEPIHVSG